MTSSSFLSFFHLPSSNLCEMHPVYQMLISDFFKGVHQLDGSTQSFQIFNAFSQAHVKRLNQIGCVCSSSPSSHRRNLYFNRDARPRIVAKKKKKKTHKFQAAKWALGLVHAGRRKTYQNHPPVWKSPKDVLQEWRKPLRRTIHIETLPEVVGTDHKKNIVSSTIIWWKLDDVINFVGYLVDPIPAMACWVSTSKVRINFLYE